MLDDFWIENYANDPRTTREDNLITEILVPGVKILVPAAVWIRNNLFPNRTLFASSAGYGTAYVH